MNDDIYEIMNQLEQYNGELLERHHTDKKKIERLEKQLEVAREALIYAKEFYQYLQMKSYPITSSEDFNDDLCRITQALQELEK